MGKALVSKITVWSRSRRRPKRPCYGRLSVVASAFAILPPSPSRFRPLALYSPFSWQLTPDNSPLAGTPTAPHGLVPYCYSPAGTLLLLFLGWHPLCPVALLTYLPPPIRRPSSVTPSRGIALPPWLLSNTCDRSDNLRASVSGYSGPTVSVFSPVTGHQSNYQSPKGPWSSRRFLCFGEPAEGFGSLYLYGV